jgi:hypothetical protein
VLCRDCHLHNTRAQVLGTVRPHSHREFGQRLDVVEDSCNNNKYLPDRSVCGTYTESLASRVNSSALADEATLMATFVLCHSPTNTLPNPPAPISCLNTSCAYGMFMRSSGERSPVHIQ